MSLHDKPLSPWVLLGAVALFGAAVALSVWTIGTLVMWGLGEVAASAVVLP